MGIPTASIEYETMIAQTLSLTTSLYSRKCGQAIAQGAAATEICSLSPRGRCVAIPGNYRSSVRFSVNPVLFACAKFLTGFLFPQMIAGNSFTTKNVAAQWERVSHSPRRMASCARFAWTQSFLHLREPNTCCAILPNTCSCARVQVLTQVRTSGSITLAHGALPKYLQMLTSARHCARQEVYSPREASTECALASREYLNVTNFVSDHAFSL